jgi:AraC family transcriptional regulator, transcriptional activator of pobA
MKLKLRDDKTGGDLLLFQKEEGFDRLYFSRDRFTKYFTIAWNPGSSQVVTIDGTEYEFPPNSLLTLLFDQSFSFERSFILYSKLTLFLGTNKRN